ncbi:hypothetical protein X777_10674 [Ooceraea biroi]|uniref:Uncharacterized protein n=1 Tax=Ooceraea biroi TaxID=2015173 RepID=A0A026W4F6_OOCBI|nr:hypothetical protein X777_10674 [Ooceraea biroi]
MIASISERPPNFVAGRFVIAIHGGGHRCFREMSEPSVMAGAHSRERERKEKRTRGEWYRARGRSKVKGETCGEMAVEPKEKRRTS